MKPNNIEILDIKYRRPGFTKIHFIADYNMYSRRGTVVFDTREETFTTHNKDVDLLLAVCTALQQPYYNKA